MKCVVLVVTHYQAPQSLLYTGGVHAPDTVDHAAFTRHERTLRYLHNLPVRECTVLQ